MESVPNEEPAVVIVTAADQYQDAQAQQQQQQDQSPGGGASTTVEATQHAQAAAAVAAAAIDANTPTMAPPPAQQQPATSATTIQIPGINPQQFMLMQQQQQQAAQNQFAFAQMAAAQNGFTFAQFPQAAQMAVQAAPVDPNVLNMAQQQQQQQQAPNQQLATAATTTTDAAAAATAAAQVQQVQGQQAVTMDDSQRRFMFFNPMAAAAMHPQVAAPGMTFINPQAQNPGFAVAPMFNFNGAAANAGGWGQPAVILQVPPSASAQHHQAYATAVATSNQATGAPVTYEVMPSEAKAEETAAAIRKRILEGQPVRPLSAYNFFFSDEREKVLSQDVADAEAPTGGEIRVGNHEIPTIPAAVVVKDDDEPFETKKERLLKQHHSKDRTKRRPHRKTHGKVGFTQLSKIIGKRWRALSEERKQTYRDIAAADLERYQKEVADFNNDRLTKRMTT